MTDATIGGLLMGDSAGLRRKLREVWGTGKWAAIAAAAAAGGTKVPASALMEAVTGKIGEMLKEPLSGLMVRTWNQSRELRKKLESTRTKGDTEFVPLLDHTLQSDQHPHIDIVNGPKVLARLNFTVHLQLRLKGVVVKVERGEVAGLTKAEVEGKGSLKLEEYVLAEREFPAVRL